MMRRCTFVAALATAVTVPASRAAAQSSPPIEAACGASDSSGLMLYAQELGLFAKAGLNVHLNVVTSTANIIPGALSGTYQVGAANIGGFAVARDRGMPLHLFGPGSVYTPSSPTAMLLVPLDSPARTAADLNGKTIGVNGLKADISMFETQAYLDRNGADSKTMKYLEIPFPEMGAALAQKRIDCAFVIEPFLSQARKIARVFVDPSSGIAPRFQTSAVFGTDAWLSARPDAARSFARAMRQAAAWANAHRRESSVILARYAKLDPDVIGGMQRADYSLSLDPALIQPVLDTAAQYGVLRSRLTAAELVWNDAG